MMDNEKLKKRMKVMLIFVGILFGSIFIFKEVKNYFIRQFIAKNQSPVFTVSSMKVGYAGWQPIIKASGSLRAIQGVNVTAELAGMVQAIYFSPGTIVKQGTVLVQQNANTDIDALHALQANADLAQINFVRDKAQYEIKGISKATLDADAANVKNLLAQVAQQAATVAKKTIVAPFTGRLGIRLVNLGQFVNPGDQIVTLQQIDPIYVDFYVPQQQFPQLKLDADVTVKVDAFPTKSFYGKITTINPLVDNTTRNIVVEATIKNPTAEILPGMFATVYVNTGEPQRFLTLPQTAVSFNPYGEIVYVINETGKDKEGKPELTVNQAFVVTGETRGDQVQILKGIKPGDIVVTSGQLKLKNGSHVTINNKIVPSNNPNPQVTND